MSDPVRRLLCGAFVAAFAACPVAAEVATPASRLTDSVGVNIHLHYQDTSYGDFAQVERALRELGVRHVRDGLVDSSWEPYYERLSALGKDGIRVLLITSPGESAAMLDGFPRRLADPSVIEGIEAPNERDAGGERWLEDDAGALRAMETAAREWHLTRVGPSLTRESSFGQIAGLASAYDFGNLHNYFGGRNPGSSGWGDDGYGSYAWNLRLARSAWGEKPVMTTETGYVMDPAQSQGIPEEVAAKYLVRLLLEQWNHGIERTYLYELLDTEIPARKIHDRYGLCRSDFARKPAFTAVQSLLELLQDSGKTERKDALDFKVEGAGADVHHLLVEKSDGEFDLMLWVEAPGYDVDRKQVLPVATRAVTVALPGSWRAEVLHFAEDGRLLPAGSQSGGRFVVRIDDRVTVLRFVR